MLDAGDRTPAVFVSAGIGVTPVLAMLAALAETGDRRPVTWIHVARSSAEHAFAQPVRAWLRGLPSARAHIRFTQPLAGDRVGRDCDAFGRLTATDLAALELPGAAAVFLCGPAGFMAAAGAALVDVGIARERIRSEAFGAARAANGVAPHRPAGPPGSGPEVTFARSGLTVAFDDRWASLLELSEACDVPADWSCRTGVCHRCESGLVAGEVAYDPEPLDRPADGRHAAVLHPPRGPGDARPLTGAPHRAPPQSRV